MLSGKGFFGSFGSFDARDLGLTSLVKKRKIPFQMQESDLGFLKKRALSVATAVKLCARYLDT